MPDAAQDVEGVGLQLLTAAAAVPVAATGELGGDLLGSDRHGRGHPLEDGHERLPMGLTGREHPEHAGIVTDPIDRAGANIGVCGGGASAAPAPATAPPVGGSPGPISAA